MGRIPPPFLKLTILASHCGWFGSGSRGGSANCTVHHGPAESSLKEHETFPSGLLTPHAFDCAYSGPFAKKSSAERMVSPEESTFFSDSVVSSAVLSGEEASAELVAVLSVIRGRNWGASSLLSAEEHDASPTANTGRARIGRILFMPRIFPCGEKLRWSFAAGVQERT